MTIMQILKASGIKFSRSDAAKIGKNIQNKAREEKVRWTKVDEVISVNDYPETYVPKMEQLVTEYFTPKK